jgi:Ca2+-dependent lipid-binding protein
MLPSPPSAGSPLPPCPRVATQQDPACVVTCGSQKVRSKTHTDGGKNPVWNQTFRFNVINENDITLTVVEDDVIGRDDLIGTGHVQLAKARQYGQDRQQVLLY